MMDFIVADVLLLILFSVAFCYLWYSNSTSTGTALALGTLLIVPLKGPGIDDWYGVPVFVGQPSIVFSCLVLAIVHRQLGPLAAHRVWRTVSVTIILTALVLTRFRPDGHIENDLTHVRLWASILLQFVMIGGLGQAFWKISRMDGFWRYALTLFAFPIASVLHSVVGFYGRFPEFDFATVSFWSAVSATYFGAMLMILMVIFIRMEKKAPNYKAKLRKSIDDLIPGEEYYVSQAKRRDRRLPSP